jgi:hypothetical protein
MDKFFNPKGWRKERKVMLKGIMTAHDGKRWPDFPVTPDEESDGFWKRRRPGRRT